MKNKDLKISVIGTGKMGFFHTRLLDRLGLLDSIADTDPSRANEIGKRYSIPVYTDYHKLIEERSPDGIIIAVPTPYHHQVATDILENYSSIIQGLLLEKPVASTIQEALEVKQAILKANVPTIIGHIEVYNPTITKVLEIINQGLIGEVRSALFQRRGAVSEGRIASLADVYEDIGVHDFDISMKLMLGKNLKVYAVAQRLKNTDNSSVVVVSDEDSKVFVTFLISREFAGKVRTLDIEGTKGTLTANTLTQIIELRSLEIARGGKDSSSIRVPFSNGEQIKVYGEPLLQEIWNFVDCIKGLDKPKVSIEDGINAMRIVEAVRNSISKNEPSIIKIP